MINSNRNHWEMLDGGSISVANTPQELWNKARNYFKWCDTNPIIVQRTLVSGKEAGKKVEEVKIRPYNVKALCLHCGMSEEYMNDILRNGAGSEWQIVVKNIVLCIYTQMFEMGMIGEFSPIFTAKALAMDKEDSGQKKIEIEYVGSLPPLATSEDEILENANLENGVLKIQPKENDQK